jgi:MazG family protein
MRHCKLSGYPGANEPVVPPQKRKSRPPQAKHRAKARSAAPSARRQRGNPGRWFEKLVALQTRLRARGGCPWDREQTHESLRRFLIEETYEVLDALESGDAKEFSSELGDLLLQIVFHAVLAEEAGRFTISDVIESMHTKMVRRHPHVFGNVKAATSAEVLKNWEQIKAAERAREGKPSGANPADESILADVPRSLPAVLEAYHLTRRASRIGFDWDSLEGILNKLDEEKREILSGVARSSACETHSSVIEEEVGDLLFVGVNIARFLKVDPEVALKGANRKFKRRFKWMEAAAAREGRRLADLPRASMEELWNESKTR